MKAGRDAATSRHGFLAVALFAALAGGCGGDQGEDARRESADRRDRADAPHTVTGAPADRRRRGCWVTLNNTRIPPPDEHPRLAATAGNLYYTNGRLWTVLSPEGIVVERPRGDGSIEMKLPWWRAVRGRLRITGRRLDAPAPALVARIPDGYGATGFQASALIFPTEGCWKVTGTAGKARLTVVTLVIKPSGQ